MCSKGDNPKELPHYLPDKPTIGSDLHDIVNCHRVIQVQRVAIPHHTRSVVLDKVLIGEGECDERER